MIQKTGKNFLQGNEACAEGALIAGCRFFAFYPITPAEGVARVMSERLPKLRGVYIQMEDEISAIASVIGASWGGVKSMTATSGPGFSLMQENIGYAVMTETPCVIVEVQRVGPSTGTPPLPMQGDVMQAKYGTHGEHEIIALAPFSVQEMFDLTIESFNLSEKYRTPVIILSDALLGLMSEEITIQESCKGIIDRKRPDFEVKEEVKAFLDVNVAPMPVFGTGLQAHVTASTHDEIGKRNVTDPQFVDKLVRRLSSKIRNHADEIVKVDTRFIDEAEIALFAYGSTARSALHIVKEARRKGLKVGLIRPITVWPFPYEIIRKIASKQISKIVVLENNLGQILSEVERAVKCRTDVKFLEPETLGSIHEPKYVMEHLERWA